MLRRVVIVGAAVALSCGALGAGIAYAKGKPVDAHGDANCAIAGKAKLSPPVVYGGTSPSGSLFQAKIKGTCTGSSGVKTVKGNLFARLPSNDCLALLTFPASDFGPIKWKGTGKYTGSSAHFTDGSFTFADPITLTVPGSGSSSVGTGSFSGQHPTIQLVFNEKVADLDAACGAKGVKKLSFATASNIDIPA